jgi:uncharacterized glyoxalase superfamily protein PhnB
MEDPFRRPTFGSCVFYKDPFAALDWLEKAFGFERSLVVVDNDGRLGHSEMRFGDGYITWFARKVGARRQAPRRSMAATPKRFMCN